MTFSRIVPDRFPGLPVAWGAPGEAPCALWRPWGPTGAHGGAPLGGTPPAPLMPYSSRVDLIGMPSPIDDTRCVLSQKYLAQTLEELRAVLG